MSVLNFQTGISSLIFCVSFFLGFSLVVIFLSIYHFRKKKNLERSQLNKEEEILRQFEKYGSCSSPALAPSSPAAHKTKHLRSTSTPNATMQFLRPSPQHFRRNSNPGANTLNTFVQNYAINMNESHIICQVQPPSTAMKYSDTNDYVKNAKPQLEEEKFKNIYFYNLQSYSQSPTKKAPLKPMSLSTMTTPKRNVLSPSPKKFLNVSVSNSNNIKSGKRKERESREKESKDFFLINSTDDTFSLVKN